MVFIKKMVLCSCYLAVVFTLTANAKLPLLKHICNQCDYSNPHGIGFVHVALAEDYVIKDLTLNIPGISLANPGDVGILSDTDYNALRVEARLFPFMNVFLLAGDIDGNVIIDLSKSGITGLPIRAPNLEIGIDGKAYGVGFDLLYGKGDTGPFASLSASFSETSLNGNFNSSIRSTTLQPRIGLRGDKFTYWVAALYLDSQQEHEGQLDLEIPNVPPIPFTTRLETEGDISLGIGLRYTPIKRLSISAEKHSGTRDYFFANVAWRF